MANILETALDLLTDIKLADAEIEATAVHSELEFRFDQFNLHNIDVPLRLKGNKHVQIAGLILNRTQ